MYIYANISKWNQLVDQMQQTTSVLDTDHASLESVCQNLSSLDSASMDRVIYRLRSYAYDMENCRRQVESLSSGLRTIGSLYSQYEGRIAGQNAANHYGSSSGSGGGAGGGFSSGGGGGAGGGGGGGRGSGNETGRSSGTGAGGGLSSGGGGGAGGGGGGGRTAGFDNTGSEGLGAAADIVGALGDAYDKDGLDTGSSGMDFLSKLAKYFEDYSQGKNSVKNAADAYKEGFGLIAKTVDKKADLGMFSWFSAFSAISALTSGVAQLFEGDDRSLGGMLSRADGLAKAGAKTGKTTVSIINAANAAKKGEEAKKILDFGEGVSGAYKSSLFWGAVESLAVMGVHSVSNAYNLSSDGEFSGQDLATTFLDTGIAGGSSMVKAATFGLVDIDTEGAVKTFQNNIDAVNSFMAKNNVPVGAQVASMLVTVPGIALVSTAEVAVKTLADTGEKLAEAGKKVYEFTEKVQQVKKQVVGEMKEAVKGTVENIGKQLFGWIR